MSRLMVLTVSIAVAMAVSFGPDASAGADAEPPVISGALTRGGDGGRTITVTNLNDDGEGSLRAALAENGARVVRFALGGVIRLGKPLRINNGNVTVAGETAPSPGITLWGAPLRIRASDVILRHVRIRVGDGPGDNPGDRDGITIWGYKDSSGVTENVLIDHCSVSWAVDENISLWFPNVRSVTIRDTIISEGLDNSVHPKGQHSMGLLIGSAARNVLIQGNLLAHNRWRNPVLTAGVTAAVINNLIYDPGFQAVHFYGDDTSGPTLAAVIGNVVRSGPSSRSKIDMFGSHRPAPDSRIFLRDNVSIGGGAFDKRLEKLAFDPFVRLSPVRLDAGVKVRPSGTVEKAVARNVGARPWDRDATDRRILAEMAAGTGQIRDTVPAAERVP